MKGIILAGGTATRLFPATTVISKQLLPIYDKPLIYYPLSILMLANIREILVISTPRDLPFYETLLGDGSRLGITLQYKVQEKPRGLADAFIIGEDFIGDDSVCLILGDNVFYGATISKALAKAVDSVKDGGAAVFGYYMKDPTAFGVVEFDKNMKAISIEEKPKEPKSHYIVPGLYFYDNNVVEYAKNVKPSARGEIEISSLNSIYLEKGELNVSVIGRGVSWFDTGTPKGMHRASGFVKTMQELQGFYVSCIEEIAWRRKFITTEQLKKLGEELKKSEYGQYILSLTEGKNEEVEF
ncbi:MAG: glucose-1-phosphate thymidylyltransferase RfbA [Clostridiales bacterium]|nr:glucose-1-phosphate thymidylyltransferase RfbA [Clostridiales bacterium]